MKDTSLRRKIEWAVVITALVVIVASVVLPLFMYKEIEVKDNKVQSFNVPINAEITRKEGKTEMEVTTSPKISEKEMERIQAAVQAQMEKDYTKKMAALEKARRLRAAQEECNDCKEQKSRVPAVPTQCEAVDCTKNPKRCAEILGLEGRL